MTEDAQADETAASEDGHRPELGKDGFDCPRCGRWAHQVWHDIGVLEWQSGPVGGGPLNLWRQAVCQRCGNPSVWRGRQMIYPLARLGDAAHADMPAEVRELYEEAAAVAVVSRRAGAALARATIERLLKVLDPDAPKKDRLDRRIERIRPKVSVPVGQMLDVVRVTGNKALHVEEEPAELVVLALDDEEGPQLVELLLETANDLVDELITKPKTAAGYWERLPAGVQSQLKATQEATGPA